MKGGWHHDIECSNSVGVFVFTWAFRALTVTLPHNFSGHRGYLPIFCLKNATSRGRVRIWTCRILADSRLVLGVISLFLITRLTI